MPIAERVKDLLGRMTIEEKFWQLWMVPGAIGDSGTDYAKGIFGLQYRGASTAAADAESTNRMQRYLRDSTRLGIPMIPFEEAVHGLMRRGSRVFPAAIGLAASFDTALMSRVASTIATEARDRGIRQVISPVINIATDVRWGRVEETYGEDPNLSSAMGRAFVREFERRGVIATPKHFVANVGDGGRDSYPIDLSRRQLEELHFPPFRSAIADAGARSVMVSYNSVDGMPASQSSALMNGTLKGDWKFRGFVISDQSGVSGSTVLHRTEASTSTATTRALNAGLDVIFQSSWNQHRAYFDPFMRGVIPTAVVDSAVARVLRVKFELGLFDDPFVSVDSARRWDAPNRSADLAREAARSSIVLLKNNGILPLKREQTVALIGEDAREGRLGGYTLEQRAGSSINDAFVERFGEAALYFAPGVERGAYTSHEAPSPTAMTPVIVPVPAAAFDSLRGEYWDNNRLDGAPRVTRRDANIDFRWTLNGPARGIPFDWYSVRWTGRITAPATGIRMLGVTGNDGYRLWLDGKLIIDNWRKASFDTRLVTVSLPAGSTHDVRLEYFESTGNARVKLVWDATPPSALGQISRRFDAAERVVQMRDVAIVVAGIEEGEFRDRASLALPGAQEELILRLAATGKPVVVVLVGGSAITMSGWINEVAAVVHMWYGGDQGGRALLDVVYGEYNPAGRLPITFPISEGQLPLVYNHKPTGRGDDYVDLTGMPLFPFGYGLSYTTFEYSALRITRDTIRADGRATVMFRVKNTGTRAGDEVPQLYVRDVLASIARPIMELKGFTRVRLNPGEEREVSLPIGATDLRFLNEETKWVTEPGDYRILVGASSKDIRLRGTLVVR